MLFAYETFSTFNYIEKVDLIKGNWSYIGLALKMDREEVLVTRNKH